MTSEIKISRGMRDVHFDRTRSSYIDGRNGVLLYRGYNIHALAEQSNYEETAYLVLNGSLPTRSQLDQFRAELAARRGLSDEMVTVLRALPRDGHPMNALQAGLAVLGMASPKVDAKDPASAHDAIVRLIAVG